MAAALAAVVYGPALDSYLVDDDFQWLEGAMRFSPATLVDVGSRTHFFRPTIEVYFATVFGLFGCDAPALHAINLAIHAANTGLVMALARAVTGDVVLAALGGLVFAVQPAPTEAVLWPSAVTTLLCATFSLLALLVDVRRSRRPAGRSTVLFTVLFTLALGCHESAVVLLPAAVLLRYSAGDTPRRGWLRDYAPAAAMLTGYVILTAWINSRNYVVTEGHYRAGGHIGRNLLDYLVALYVGRRRTVEYALVVAVVIGLCAGGTRRVRGWTAWMLLALVPVLPFAWGNSSRYLYVPAIPFSWLLATGVLSVASAAAGRLPPRFGRPSRIAIAAMLTVFLLGRSMSFGRSHAVAFHSLAQPYEALARTVPATAPSGHVVMPAQATAWLDQRYVTPLVRVAVCDPGVTVEVR